ncbi:MAG: hypothetical protein SGBAC_008865 [Bacillariaceae sp.]
MMDVNKLLPTISLAGAASFAFLTAILAGTNCNFVEISAVDGDVLVSTDGDELDISQAGLGVVCPSDMFSTEDDTEWGISRIFFYLSIVSGAFTTIGAIALASKVEYTNARWRNLSIGAALTALCAVPVFLVFEANPCTEFQFQQTCTFSTGSYLQIISVLCWVVGVAITQCLDPSGVDAVKEGDEIPPNPTDSMPSDEEQGSSPRSITPPIGDILPVEEEKKEEEGEFESFAGAFNAFAELKEERKAEAVSSSPDKNLKTIGRITVTPEDESSKAISNYPAYQEEPLQTRTPFQSKMAKTESQKEQPLSDFANFENFDDAPPPPPASKPSKEKFGSMMKIMPIAPQKKMANRLSSLKSSFTNIQRPSFGGRRPQVYDQMMEDDMSRSSKGSMYNPVAVAMRGDNMSVRSSVPSEESSVVSKTMSQIGHEKLLLDDWNALHAATNAQQQTSSPEPQVIQRHIKLDHEQEREDWHALHMAMTAGVRMGLIEGMSGAEDPYEMASYHSDPEPIIYSSDEDEEDDIELYRSNHIPQNIIPDDNSTISSHSSTSVANRHSSKSRRSLRSKRRQRSDLSVSLLSLTIDEETVADILEETSEDELQHPYSFVRTTSAPEPRRAPGIEVSLASRARRPLADGDAGSVKTARPTILTNFGQKRRDPLDLGLATPTRTDPLYLGVASSPYKDPLDLGMAASPMASSPYNPYNDPLDRDPLEQMEDDVHSDDKTAPRENAMERKHHRVQSDQVQTAVTPQKPPLVRREQSAPTPPIAATSPMLARRLRDRVQRDDSSSSESDGGIYDKRERARALRIRRMQNQPLNTSNSTDETDLNTSYASKYSMGSSLPSPARSLPSPPIKKQTSHIFEEKKEDDRSESSARVVTPDSKAETQSLSFKKDTTFDEDDLNVDDLSVEVVMEPSSAKSAGRIPSIVVQDPATGLQTSSLSKGLQQQPIVSPTIGGDDISIITPHHDIKDSDSDEDAMHLDYVKAGANKVRERILNKFSFSERSQASKSQASVSHASSDNSQKYGSHMMDRLDLQLIEVRRPQGAEYGDEEMSL